MSRSTEAAHASLHALMLGACLCLGACRPSEAELQAAATRIAAEIFATQTASAPTPTPSRAPTVTPTPSRTPSPTPIPDASVLGSVVAVYDGPGIQYSYVAEVRAGERLEVLGGFQECSWLKVSDAPGLEGWLRNDASLVALNLECVSVPPGTFRPYTGSLILDHRPQKGRNHLTIDNGTDMDGAVILLEGEDSPLIACYVRGASTYTLIGVPDGSYRVLFTIGEEWSGDDGRFTSLAQYLAFEREAVFNSSASRYSIVTLTLHPVEGGTARIEPLSPLDFPDLGG